MVTPPPIVRVEGLGKRFRKPSDRASTLKEALIRGTLWAKEDWFWGLRNVDFSVQAGSMLGVIGHNGAGKSTLLRLLGGVGMPDEGRVHTLGSIGALLDLGVGFHPDLTGRENMTLAGIVAGLTRRELARRADAIIEFSELQQFIDAPVRTYSSGMALRLAFSVVVHTDPRLLLIDEVLAVGDLAFQAKCIRRIKELQAAGVAIVLVSHDVDQVAEHCDQVLWLKRGAVVDIGEARQIVPRYQDEMAHATRLATRGETPLVHLASGAELRAGHNRFGSLDVEIVRVAVCGVAAGLPGSITSGDPAFLEVDLLAHQTAVEPVLCVSLETQTRVVCVDVNTAESAISLGTFSGIRRIRVHFARLDLSAGNYRINVGVYPRDWAHAFDEHCDVYELQVVGAARTTGVVAPPTRWEIAEGEPLPLEASSAGRVP